MYSERYSVSDGERDTQRERERGKCNEEVVVTGRVLSSRRGR